MKYYANGSPKVQASFSDGLPDGDWIFYIDKGKIIKKGKYQKGAPIGIWQIYDKNGGKEIVSYDFDNSKTLFKKQNERYLKNNAITKEDTHSEWILVYFPKGDGIQEKLEPLGGYPLNGDFFVKNMDIPEMFFNSYIHQEYRSEFTLSRNIIENRMLHTENQTEVDDKSLPVFPFIVKTNSEKKLSEVQFSDASLELLKYRVEDDLLLMGPWVSSNEEKYKISIQIPLVINKIYRNSSYKW